VEREPGGGGGGGGGGVVGGGIDSLSDVLLTRVFYSGLGSDDLCRCAGVSTRWNRLVWNPLLWTRIDLSHAPDCDADAALRPVSLSLPLSLSLSLSLLDAVFQPISHVDVVLLYYLIVHKIQ